MMIPKGMEMGLSEDIPPLSRRKVIVDGRH